MPDEVAMIVYITLRKKVAYIHLFLEVSVIQKYILLTFLLSYKNFLNVL